MHKQYSIQYKNFFIFIIFLIYSLKANIFVIYIGWLYVTWVAYTYGNGNKNEMFFPGKSVNIVLQYVSTCPNILYVVNCIKPTVIIAYWSPKILNL